MEEDNTPLFNRSFQKKEVVKKLVKDEPCDKIATPLEIPGMSSLVFCWRQERRNLG